GRCLLIVPASRRTNRGRPLNCSGELLRTLHGGRWCTIESRAPGGANRRHSLEESKVDFRFTPAQEQFRHEIRSFLDVELADRANKPEYGEGFSQAFSKKLAARGWIGSAWPKEYGGQEL